MLCAAQFFRIILFLSLFKESGIREFGRQNRCFGWKRFCSYDHLKSVDYPLFLQLNLRLFTEEGNEMTSRTSLSLQPRQKKSDEWNANGYNCDTNTATEISTVHRHIKDWIARDLWKDKWAWDALVCVKNKVYFQVHSSILRGTLGSKQNLHC